MPVKEKLHPVVDPGLRRWGSQPMSLGLKPTIFCKTMHENAGNCTESWVCVPSVPLDPPVTFETYKNNSKMLLEMELRNYFLYKATY